MPMAHLCDWCGLELSRVSSVYDRELALRVVMCPGCGRGAVRRRHPLPAFFRRMVRLNAALERLLLQLFAIWVFGSFTILGISLTIETFGRGWRSSGDDWLFIGFFYGIVPIAMGAWLYGAFAHARSFRVWLSWFVAVYVAMALGYSFGAITDAAWNRWGESFEVLLSRAFHDAPLRALTAVLLLGAMMVVALAGIPLGALARWASHRFRSWRFNFRRRRRRMEAHSV
jgi:hypothetical protein